MGISTTDDVVLDDVHKRFGSVRAVDGISLSVPSGAFFSFLGPSGSGKTTCLRMIAGFERPTSGRVLLHGVDVADQPPFDRDVNTVFQDYALFPHLSVGRNVEYGLKVKRVAKATRRRQATEALELVRLAGYENRKISELSGGQRQRVALARALVNRPRVLLLDEPLGALDLKLREEMQHELKRIQTEVGITFLYVTHDQDEALAMSDVLAVFDNGRLEQVGSPAEVYEHPASPFVAGFVGTSNLFEGEVARRLRGSDETFTVRPEKIQLLPRDTAGATNGFEVRATGTVRAALYLGERTRYTIELDGGGQLTAVEQNRTASSSDVRTSKGMTVSVAWERQCDQVLAADGSASTLEGD